MTSNDLREIAGELEAWITLTGHRELDIQLERIARELRALADRIDAGEFKHQ